MIVAGVLAVLSFDPDDGAVLAVRTAAGRGGVLRRAAGARLDQQVLERLELEDADAVRQLPEERQRSVVVSILRREMGVMTLAAVVVCFLAVRAIETL